MKKNDKILKYESIISAALLRFDKLDILDIELLCDLLVQAGFNVPIEFDYKFFGVGRYIRIDDSRIIRFRAGIDLNSRIPGTFNTIRDLFESVAGRSLTIFLNSLDVDSFRRQKERKVSEEKEAILDFAGVLLISDDFEDYIRFKKYGYKNVDYFPSVVRAEIYFAEKPKELEKYQVLVFGSQSTIDGYRNRRLTNLIRKLETQKRILSVDISNCAINGVETCYMSFSNYRSWQNYYVANQPLKSAMDNLILGAIANRIPEQIDLNVPFWPADIPEKIFPIKQFPKRKKDLRILFLGSFVNSAKEDIFTKKVMNSMGLNIALRNEDNFSNEDVMSSLGDYDIIVGNEQYFGKIPLLCENCSTLCGFTGRPLAVLLTYKDFETLIPQDIIDDEYVAGSSVALKYSFGGYKLESKTLHNLSFTVPVTMSNAGGQFENDNKKDEVVLEAVIEVAMGIYASKAKDMGYALLDSEGLRSPNDFHLSFESAHAEEETHVDEELKPNRIIEGILTIMKDYLKYKKSSLIVGSPREVSISESDSGYRVDIVHEGITLCALTFSKNSDSIRNLVIFNIQINTKKGRLSEPMTVGVYHKSMTSSSVPRRPDDREWQTINGIYTKLKMDVLPLIDDVRAKEQNGGKIIRFAKNDKMKA